MHAPRAILAGVTLLALLVLGIACGKKSSTPTRPPVDDPMCAVSPESLNFGSIRLGSATDLTFSIANTGGGTLSGTLSDTSAAFTLLGATSYSLTAGQFADFTVRFVPLREGAQSATILTGSSGCPTVTCLGATPADPICAVWPISLGFGEVDLYSSKDMTFEIENGGGGVLVGTVTSPKPDFQVVGNATYSLAANQSATITVRFSPTVSGSQVCFLNTGCTEPDSFLVVGQGVLPTGTKFAELDFGQVALGQSAQRTFTVSYSTTCGTNPYAVCTSTPSTTPFVVDGAYPGSPSYRCGTDYSITFPHTYTVFFTPQQAGTQHCFIKLQCQSDAIGHFVHFGYVACTGVGY